MDLYHYNELLLNIMALPAKIEKAQKSHLKNKCQINISAEKVNSPFARLTGLLLVPKCL